jgi:hypothetical protein
LGMDVELIYPPKDLEESCCIALNLEAPV